MPPRTRLPALLWLAALGCDPGGPPPAGTLVGNPGKTEMVVARLGEPLTLDLAIAEGVTLDLVGCAGEAATVIDHADAVPLLDGDGYPVPGGSWCGLLLEVERLEGSGDGPEASRFEVTLEPAVVVTLWAAEPVVVDETEYVLELARPGWLVADDLPPPDGEGQPSVIGPESEIAALLVLEVAEGSAWYPDDGDGRIDETERASGPIAAANFPPPAELDPEAEDTGADTSVAFEGCGNCATGGRPSGWIWAAAAAALLRARRRTGGPPPPAAR